MPRHKKNLQPAKATSKESAYLLLPWACQHYPDRSEIEAYIPGRDWEVVAEIPANAGVDAELIAGFIIRTVNEREQTQNLMGQMTYALELCLACDGKLTWEAEQETNVVLQRAQQITRNI